MLRPIREFDGGERMFYIYLPDGTPVGLVENYVSAEWERKMYEPGAFEIEVMATREMLELLRLGRIVVKDGEAGIIEGISFERADNAPILTARGCELDGVFKRRLVMQEEALKGIAERVVLELIDANCCQGGERKIAGMTVPVSKGRGPEVTLDDAYTKELGDVITRTLEGGDIGVRVRFPSWKVEMFGGLDRTSGQSINPRAILSVEGETLLSLAYENDVSDYKNLVIVKCKPPELEEFTRYYGSATGLDRREYLVTASKVDPVVTVEYPPIEQGGGVITTTDYGAGADEIGRRELANRAECASLTGAIARNLVYRVDYDLGDRITIESQELGISQDVRITEVKETYSEQGLDEIELVFGKKSSIKQLIRRLGADG